MLRVRITDKPQQGSMFGAAWEAGAWMRAAEGWAAEQGVEVERWRVDRRFQAGGRWYVVERVGESWEVKPESPEEPPELPPAAYAEEADYGGAVDGIGNVTSDADPGL
jgi:hypothetical protein